MAALADAALDQLADALLPKLVARGVLMQVAPRVPLGVYSDNYDDPTCAQFLNPDHLGDSVLDRMGLFFGELDSKGEISSPDLVQLLAVKGPTSLPANLTNPMKKRARKLGIPVPWVEGSTPDGAHTVWHDRDGIAGRMVAAIATERARRGLA